MNDIKSIVSVIKILERTIGVLESCNDAGKIPDSTRKRIIEMLNKATLEIYFLNNVQESGVSSDGEIPEKEETVEISEISNAVEETVSEETVEEVVSEELVPEELELTLETVVEEPVSETVPEEEILDTAPEEYIPEEEENIEIEEEENVIENIPEENTISEDSIFQQDPRSDKPLLEWENAEPEPEPVQETKKNDEINILKLQLEEERKRLEQDLQNWQEERRKKDEEMLAMQKLLEALQQPAISQTLQNQNQQNQPQPQPAPQQTQTAPQQPQSAPQQPPAPESKQASPQVQQPQQAVKEPHIRREFVKEPAKKEEPQESARLLDSFGSKKVLHESFESDGSVVNQRSTPVSSLTKAIGINDKFRFIKELFGGDSDLYNETIKRLDTTGSLISAISYIESNFSWDKNSDSVKQLISLIRRRYM
jgi:hypothetical protein